MDSDTTHPLSPEEAKACLRAAAQQITLVDWMSQHTWRVLALSLAGGIIVGRLRVPIFAGSMMMQRLVPILLTVFLRNRKRAK